MVAFSFTLWKRNEVGNLNTKVKNKNVLDTCNKANTEPVLLSQHKIIETSNLNTSKTQYYKNQALDNSYIDRNGNIEIQENIEKSKNSDLAENKEKSTEYSDIISNFTAKDNGYAWIVLAAMFFTNTLTFGYVKSFGVVYNAIAESNPNATATMAGIMMGLLSGFKSILAPFAGAMGNMIGMRLTMFIGTFISCVSLIGAYFCSSPIHYAIVLGAMIGLSQCIIESCQVVIMPSFFEKRLSFANGIRVAGNPFGGVIYPLLLAALLEFYGLKLTFILLAGVTAQIFVCAALVRPWNIHLKIEGTKFIKTNLDKRLLAAETNEKENNELNGLRKRVQRKLLDEVMTKCSEPSGKKKKPLDFSYLKNPVYLLFIAMAIGIPLACPLVYYYVSIYSKSVLNLSTYEVSSLVAVQSVVDVLMRLGIGAISSKNFYKMSHGYIFCLVLSGVGCLCIPMATGFWSLLSFTFVFSFGPNSFHTFTSVILTNQFGKESIATTWGFVRMTQGIFSFIHPVLLGYIIDASGGYTAAFITMGSGMIFAGLAVLIEPLVIKITKSPIIIS